MLDGQAKCFGEDYTMDKHPLSPILLVFILSVLVLGEDETDTLSCPKHQKAFDGSCYEFFTMQRSFVDAQSWCERSGGHLTFIQNDETQQFLQQHLQFGKHWWLGLAPTSFNLSLDLDDAANGKWFELIAFFYLDHRNY